MRPEWIVDSIKAQTLLSEEDYLLERLRGGPAQKTIHAFKQVTAQPLGEDIIYPAARPTLGRLQQQQAQAEKLQEAQEQQPQFQQQQDQPPGPSQSDATRAAAPSCSDTAAAAAVHVGSDREPSGAAAEHDDDAEQGDCVTAAATAPEQACSAAAVSDDAPRCYQPDEDWGLARNGASAVATLGHSSSNTDAGSQYGAGDAVSEPHPVPKTRQAAAAATWTPEDMRIAQAAAATARGRCDMLKVRCSTSTPEHASIPRSSSAALSTAPSCAVSATHQAVCSQGAPKSTRDDPDYVKNYFAASRLHFIGTWKVCLITTFVPATWQSPALITVSPARSGISS